MVKRGVTVAALVVSVLNVPAATAQESKLAARFAPVVWLHSADRFGPMDPAAFLRSASLRWRKALTDGRVAAAGAIESARLGARCAAAPRSCYRWDAYRADQLTRPFHGHSARPAKLKTKHGFYLDVADAERPGDTSTAPRVPMFYETRPAGGGTRIVYWLFYGFSRPFAPFAGANLAAKFSHEGDWENVDVVVGRDGKPRSVTFYMHGKAQAVKWHDVCKEVAGRETCGSPAVGRPIVFSARESHASYSTPADRRGPETEVCERHVGLRVCSQDFRNRGTRWDVAGRPGALLDARAQPWYGFGGAWGTAGLNGEMTGPLGPSLYKRP